MPSENVIKGGSGTDHCMDHTHDGTQNTILNFESRNICKFEQKLYFYDAKTHKTIVQVGSYYQARNSLNEG